MMHLFVNAVAASAGGGLTYIRNFVAHLSQRDDIRATILLSPEAKEGLFADVRVASCPRMQVIEFKERGPVSRFWREQIELPRLIVSRGADVLLSTGNIALKNSPVPQILLSRNALYTSKHFFHDLRERGHYSLYLVEHCKRALAKRSIAWADCTIAPSATFAGELQSWTGRDVLAVDHGFDGDAFFAGPAMPQLLQAKMQAADGCLRLLFVSHYNYYRNFETLLRAVPIIKKQLSPLPLRLFLTCELRGQANPGSYRSSSASALVSELQIRDEVIELGAVPHQFLHHVYQACDLYVTPAYAESFAHPLIEAMASGLPIIAADLPVHREICQNAAVYPPVFSPEILAQRVVELAKSPALRKRLADYGRRRARDFSWSRHVQQIIEVAKKLTGSCLEQSTNPSPAQERVEVAS